MRGVDDVSFPLRVMRPNQKSLPLFLGRESLTPLSSTVASTLKGVNYGVGEKTVDSVVDDRRKDLLTSE